MSVDRTIYIDKLHDNISEELLYELFTQASLLLYYELNKNINS